MRTAPPVFYEDGVRYVTLATQTQAVERAIQTMHTHLQEALTLEDLASVACLSPSHFHRLFRRLIGIPQGEFLSALCFQAARRLLVATPLSVTGICFEVDYTSTGSFTSRFTHLVGISSMPWLCVLLHALVPQEPCNRRSWRTRAFEYSALCAAKTRVSCPCFAISRSFANASCASSDFSSAS